MGTQSDGLGYGVPASPGKGGPAASLFSGPPNAVPPNGIKGPASSVPTSPPQASGAGGLDAWASSQPNYVHYNPTGWSSGFQPTSLPDGYGLQTQGNDWQGQPSNQWQLVPNGGGVANSASSPATSPFFGPQQRIMPTGWLPYGGQWPGNSTG